MAKLTAVINGQERIVKAIEYISGRSYRVTTWNGDIFFPERMKKAEVVIQGQKRIAKKIYNTSYNVFQIHCWNGDVFEGNNKGYTKIN
jgi:hypothetical protein